MGYIQPEWPFITVSLFVPIHSCWAKLVGCCWMARPWTMWTTWTRSTKSPTRRLRWNMVEPWDHRLFNMGPVETGGEIADGATGAAMSANKCGIFLQSWTWIQTPSSGCCLKRVYFPFLSMMIPNESHTSPPVTWRAVFCACLLSFLLLSSASLLPPSSLPLHVHV